MSGTWTTDTPTQPGWYWYRLDGDLEVVHIYYATGENQLMAESVDNWDWAVCQLEGEWIGPIEVPV